MKTSLFEAVAFLYFYTTNSKVENVAEKCRVFIEEFYGVAQISGFAGVYQDLRDQGYPFTEKWTTLEVIEYTIELLVSYLDEASYEEKALIFQITNSLTKTYAKLYAAS